MQITEKWLDRDGPSGEPGRGVGQELRENRCRPLPIVACFSSSQPLSSCPHCELVGFEQHPWLGQYLWRASADRFYHGSLGQRHRV